MKAGLRDGLYGLGLLCAMAALLLCPQIASEAVVDGLSLCGRLLLPSLFPFFVCSDLLIALDLAGLPAKLLGPVLPKCFRVPSEGAAALFLGALGGYPSGARAAARLYGSGVITEEAARRLLRFCNNAGPAFVLGVVGLGVFHSLRLGAVLYGIHLFSAVLTGVLLRQSGPPGSKSPASVTERKRPTFATAFTSSVRSAGETALAVCMFVVVFSVLSRFLLALLPDALSPCVKVLLCGLLELSNGAALLGQSALPFPLAFPMAAFLLGFGGIGVWAQTAAVFQSAGLTLRGYLPAKLLQGLLSAGLALGLEGLLPVSLPAFSPLAQPSFWALNLPGLAAAGSICWYFRKLISGNSDKKGV